MLGMASRRQRSHWIALGVMTSFLHVQPGHAEPFVGRFETTSNGCRYTLSDGKSGGCRVVQIAGRSAMVLGVQFIGRGPVRGSSRSLTFVAKTESGQTSPLSCHLGRCRLTGTNWSGTVTSVSEAAFDADGIAEGLPKAWPSRRGHCKLEAQQIHCRVDVVTGKQLHAQARL